MNSSISLTLCKDAKVEHYKDEDPQSFELEVMLIHFVG